MPGVTRDMAAKQSQPFKLIVVVVVPLFHLHDLPAWLVGYLARLAGTSSFAFLPIFIVA